MWTLRAGGRDGPRHSSTVPFLQPPHCPRIAPRHHPECLSALAARLVRITRVPQAPPGPSGVIESYGLGPGQLCQGPLLTDSSSSSEYVWRLPSPAHGAVPALSHLEVEWPSPWPAVLTALISPVLPPLSAKVTFPVCKYD